MNCEQLQQDISNYKEQLSSLQDLIKEVSESAQKPEGFNKKLAETQDLSDALLNKYLTDFIDQFPELNRHYEFGDRIKGFEGGIATSTPLPDGRVLVGGRDDEARILNFNGNGEASFGDEIEGFEDCVRTSTLLPDGRVLVGGDDGEARILSFNENGEASFGDKIKGFKGFIFTSTLLPDGRVLVGGDYGEARILSHKTPTDPQSLKANLDKILETK